MQPFGVGLPNKLHLVCDSCNTVRVELVKSGLTFPSDHSLGDGRQTRSDARLQLVGKCGARDCGRWSTGRRSIFVEDRVYIRSGPARIR